MKLALVGGESLLVQCGTRALARGHEITMVVSADPAARQWAADQAIPVRDLTPGLAVELRATVPDILLSIANLTLLPAELLAAARRGAVNFHDGPLPRFGGLNAPMWALLQGESEHGITWHRMTTRADAGDILVQRRFPIDPGETALTLNVKCFQAGLESFDELLDALESDRPGTPHLLDQASFHRSFDRPPANAVIQWTDSTDRIGALVRALAVGRFRNPLAVPKVWLGTTWAEVGAAARADAGPAPAATVLAVEPGAVTVAAGDGAIRVTDWTTADGRAISTVDDFAALGVRVGAVLPIPDSRMLATFESRATAVAKAEPFWTRALAASNPLEVPGAGPTGEWLDVQTALPHPEALVGLGHAEADAVQGALALFFSAHCGTEGFDLALAAATTPLELPWVPLRVDLDRVTPAGTEWRRLAAEIAARRARAPIAADLLRRQPGLKAVANRWPLALAVPSALDRGEPVATQLTVVVDGGSLRWRSAVLTAEQLNALAARFGNFLSRLIATLEQPMNRQHDLSIDELALVGGALRIGEWEDLSPRTIHEEFAARAALDPAALALVCEGDALSYGELDRRSNQLARRLLGLGLRTGMPVGVCLERSNDLIVAVLGILKAGGAYLPLDPKYPADRLAFMVADAELSLLVTTEHLLDLIEKRPTAICLDREAGMLDRLDPAPLGPTSAPNDLAYLIYTSGSTGRPKGVMVEHRNVFNFFQAMDRKLGRAKPGVWLAVTSLSFDISVLELLWTLTRGYKVVVYLDEKAANPFADLPNAGRGIDFSLFYFSAAGDAERAGVTDKYRVLMEGARFGDEHGFTAVWTPERHFHAFGGLYPNPAVTGAAVAAITSRIGIRAGSSVIPLHHPVRVAEEWAVVDNLSNGRVGLSVAAGWQPDDFIFKPENYRDAKAVMFRDLEVIRRLWRGEAVAFPGPKGDVSVRALPRPVQAELPIWVTTAGNIETFEAAGTAGARVLTHLLGQSVAEIEAKITAYRRAWRIAGHDGDGYVSLMLHTFVGDDTDSVREVVRGPMKEYLRTSISLIKNFAAAFPTFKKDEVLDFNALTPEEHEALLDYSFERYFETSGLFGDLETCAAMVDRLKGIGVDEIACLIDFGVPADQTLAHLKHLNRLRQLTAAPARTGDFSVAAQIMAHGVTHLQCTPSMASMFMASERTRSALRRLHTLLVGGEALSPALAAELSRAVAGRILNMYGPTETTVWSTTGEVAPGKPVTIGRPILNTEIWILDRAGRPVAPGRAGELCIGGAGVTRGYWNRPDLTAERYPEVAVDGGSPRRLYRTGDLARFGADGTIEFLGRLDTQVKVRGYRIELGEIESVLSLHPAVVEVAAVVQAFGPDDNRVVLFYTPRAEVTADALREWARQRLPEFMVPSWFEPIRALPRTPNQKIDRRALPDVTARSAPPAAPSAPPPAGGLEARIGTIWQEVLKVPAVGVDDNFFDLGGHSLLAVQVHGRLRKEIAPDLAITDLFRFPTIRGLARFLEGGADASQVKASLDRGAARRAALERRTAARTGG